MSKFDKQELIQKLMGTFLDEMEEHVQTLNNDLLILEKCASDTSEYKETVRSLFRAAHSLKGAARSVDVHSVEQICHELEDLLGQLREPGIKANSSVFALLFTAAQMLTEAGTRLRHKQEINQSDVEHLLGKLKSASKDLSQFEDQEDGEASYAEENIVDSIVILEDEAVADALHTQDEAAAMESTPEKGHSVRVSAEKLDQLLALSSEFLTSYRRSETWAATVDELSERLRDTIAEWQNMQKPIQQTIRNGLEAGRTGNAPKQNQKRFNKIVAARMLAAPNKATGTLKEFSREIERFLTLMKADVRTIGETARLVDEEIRALRMRPFSDACLGLQLAIRELALSTGKEVLIDVQGGNIELDRSVLESLKDPLLHIVRNAVQHGIEKADEREALGKSPHACIRLSAALSGSHVQIEIRDDGRGINEDAVKAQAAKNGWPPPQNKEEITHLLFQPWFSTASTIDKIAGRGVGLDVVANQVSALQGTVSVTYEVGVGTCFNLTVPLTLTKIRALLVRADNQTFALPCATIDRLLRVSKSDLRFVEGSAVIAVEQQLVSLHCLSDTLQLTSGGKQLQDNQESKILIMVLSQGGSKKAFVVEELLAENEVVVTNLGARLERLLYTSGATILPNGEIAIILNVPELLKHAHRGVHRAHTETSATARRSTKQLLVVDDSPTTRILETSILKAAGYEVIAVADGQNALEVLHKQEVDLVISDVEMPHVDGFELTHAIRASEKLRHLPIILVTSLARESDKRQGLEAGANAYVVKSEFDQSELLNTIEQLL